MTGKVDQILDDPAKSQVARRKQLNNIAKLPDDELAKLTPEQLKKVMTHAANLDEDDKPKDKESSLRINVELDLEVEVNVTARVKGDITIGLL